MSKAIDKAGYHYDYKYWASLVDYYNFPWHKRIFKKIPKYVPTPSKRTEKI